MNMTRMYLDYKAVRKATVLLCFIFPYQSDSLRNYNFLSGMREVSEKYDAFIIDQWGVLHDGKKPYAGSMECLLQLQQRNKTLILLSNSSKRRKIVEHGLDKIGFDSSIFHDCITSGEISWNILNKKDSPKKIFVIGNGEDDSEYISTFGGELSSLADAELVVVRGTFSIINGISVTNYAHPEELMRSIHTWLLEFQARGLPMLVTNPDVMRPGSGSPMPGQIGRLYADVYGGVVRFIGKPYREVYDACFLALENILQRPRGSIRICGVGDSLLHDIMGANQNHIANVWIANGVHSAEMHVQEGAQDFASVENINALFQNYREVALDHSVPLFRW